MTAETPATRRIGFIRIDADVWERHGHAIRRCFADCMILEVRPDNTTRSVDLVMFSTKFAPVETTAQVPRYNCDLIFNADGSVIHGKMIPQV